MYLVFSKKNVILLEKINTVSKNHVIFIQILYWNR